MATALYPGAFKPPHSGHFNVVKSLLDGTHGGKLYDKDTAANVGSASLTGESDKVDSIDKVVIFIGGKDRNGVSPGISKDIWTIYTKYLGNVELHYQGTNPMQDASAYAKNKPEEKFYAVTGIRGEEDMVDLKRITSFKNRDNVEGLVFAAPGGVRATDLRKAILSGNLDLVTDFFPKQLKREEILEIVKMLKNAIISEIMLDKVDTLFESWFDKPINEGSSGAPVAHASVLKSEDRHKLVKLFTKLRSELETEDIRVTFNQDHIRIALETDSEKRGFDYTPYMASILEYMLDEGMKITPLPEIKVKKDLAESEQFFGRTAYYDPNENSVVLYTQSRHPKDVMRSFTHEMVHHMQNLDGRLGKIETTDTNASEDLLELEKEAYLVGNVTFRNWEDKTKKGYDIT